MAMSENNGGEKTSVNFESLDVLLRRWREGTFGEILDDWKWIFSYSAHYKGAILFYTLLGVFSATLSLAASVASKYLIDIIIGYETSKLGLMAAIMLGSSTFSLVFSSVLSRISAKLSLRINNEIQADIFDQIIEADWMEINRFPSGDVLNRFNADVHTVASNAISWLPKIIIAFYNFIATFIVIWYNSKLMAVLSFASAPIMLFMSKYLIKKQRDYSKKVRQMSSKLMGFEVETFYNFDMIKSFGITNNYGKKLRQWQEKYKEVSLEHNMFTIMTNIFMSVLAMIVQYAAFAYCLYLLWTHQITYGTMTLFLEQRAKLASAFSNVVGIIPSFLNSSVSAHRIRELVQLPKEKHIEESAELNELSEYGFSVKMAGVNFRYNDEGQVITDSDFIASPGEIVALVGPSGEGKTTMIRLMLGLIHPESGHVTLEAHDGRHVDANTDTRYLFSYVPQGNTILSGTIAENLRMVKEDATDEEIIQALKTACAWDFVSKKPDGINTAVGERGKGLSEGQSQRIAIARALLRDAPILLLDEATSALDVTTERNVLRNIITEEPTKTCIVTTHRPSVLNLCKRVYRVMDTHVTELSEEESARMAIDF